ncbi:hypothetical protein [Microcystis phage Mae-Yong1326-1]|nr:hypothetical protein [Microcystis phage Mae-Yong1326-1]
MPDTLTRATKAQILSGAREVRAMCADRLSAYVPAGPQRRLAWRFLAWCERTGTRFGHANLDEVFARFQADEAAEHRAA